jgi:hypothetical protein
MTLNKPKRPPRVQITALDKETNKSKTITVYETTPEKVIELIVNAMRNTAQHAAAVA